MKILLLEPFFSGSHRQWAEGYQASSRHKVELMTLPGRHWKWRMFGAAPALAQRFRQRGTRPDLILATDMLDLAGFLGHTRHLLPNVPVALYFHENQLTYPWSSEDADVKAGRERQYAYLNFTSALAADQVFFNSDYHRNDFIEALPAFLRAFPDYQGLSQVAHIARKSQTLYLGMALKALNEPAVAREGPPVLLWNHRWEYDKAPDAFFRLLFRLQAEGVPFRVIVLGQAYRKAPPIFEEAKAKLGSRLLHWGYTPDRAAYARLLRRADLLPVTSRQDFFGGSTVEAIYAGCYPLLPNRLAFPEHLPDDLKAQHLYTTEEECYAKIKSALGQLNPSRDQRRTADFVARYDWSNLAEHYDIAMEQLFRRFRK